MEPRDTSPNEHVQSLTALLGEVVTYDGFFEIVEGFVNVTRATKTGKEQTHLFAQPSICIVPQGAKVFSVMQDDLSYVEDHTNMVVYSAEVPISFAISQASTAEPYYCLMIPLLSDRIRDLSARIFTQGMPRSENLKAVYINDLDVNIVKTSIRLFEVIKQQQAIDLLVPHLIDEILMRLLLSPMGASIAQLGVADSHAEKVVRAITWIKQNYFETMTVADLAQRSGMSVSSFHTHFKSITSMSPLQYQKMVRLQQARTLLKSRIRDVSSAAYEVGYTSTSQFSREYSRAFGVAPSRDIL
ncbi:AraC family transcriptional regulator [Marinomonas ostreistagni]|uniref:AraC family transcriptional regulator n=1 Tax=Marinomonas ostreistagni TaxID=359209 RepID=A0ABS0Z8U2_9GAMM|nr:AraC family transcriptional regulator [Marinomonas ostreistagni]MBJ7550077.1 AraC family transcriptional regulator [Marinomonas ostreistagni]